MLETAPDLTQSQELTRIRTTESSVKGLVYPEGPHMANLRIASGNMDVLPDMIYIDGSLLKKT